MNVQDSEIETLREDARRIRASLRFPFASGLSEDELVAAAWKRARGPQTLERARTLLPTIAKQRQEDVENKYRNIVIHKAREQCEKRDLPKQRLDGEDLANDVLLKAAQRHDEFRGRSEGEYVSWLFTILNSEAVNAAYFHGAAMRDANRERPQNVDDSAPSPMTQQVDSQRSSPSEKCRTAEFVNAVVRLVSNLNELEMKAFELRYIRNATMTEVEEELGLTKRVASKLCGAIDRRFGQVRGLADGIRASKFSLQEIILEAWNLRHKTQPSTEEKSHE